MLMTPKFVLQQQESEVPLERQHSDLRLAPVDVPEELDMSDPLNHFDLRLAEVKADKKPE